MERDLRDLFQELCIALAVRPDRKGEAHVACPNCGKEAKRGQTHFSFSESGGHCFVCGFSCGLVELAKRYQIIEDTGPRRPYVPPPAPKPKPEPKHYSWQDRAVLFMRAYANHELAVRRWQHYKPLSEDTIRERHLGLGAFPEFSSKCPHDRLQVPLICSGRVVGFRGRAIGCQCGKWLSPAGSRMVLYNGARLIPPALRSLGCDTLHLGDTVGPAWSGGQTVVIVENPIDALMIEEQWGRERRVVAVATLGVSMWRDEWTEALAQSMATNVVIAYDNDLPGNGGGDRHAELADQWRRDKGTEPPTPGGVRLANRLSQAGVKGVALFPWEDLPVKADVGDLLRGAL